MRMSRKLVGVWSLLEDPGSKQNALEEMQCRISGQWNYLTVEQWMVSMVSGGGVEEKEIPKPRFSSTSNP